LQKFLQAKEAVLDSKRAFSVFDSQKTLRKGCIIMQFRLSAKSLDMNVALSAGYGSIHKTPYQQHA